MDSKFFENEVIIVEKTSWNLGFQRFSNGDPIKGNSSKTIAVFRVYRKNLMMKAAPKDSSQQTLFCRALNQEHTAKVKKDKCSVTIRFVMYGVITMVKAEDGSEVLTLAPVDGSEDLFNASQLISIRRTEKGITMERQIAFDCDTEFLDRIDVYQYLGKDGPSDR